jgi:aryl-phospho-beta-D-glucosidase BglC (GH1 family)
MTQEELDQYKEPWLVGGWDYLVRTLKWIQKYGGKAIIDLHAAPGRQNPWPFTGKTNDCTWGIGDTMNRTYLTLERVSQRIQQFEQDPELNNVVMGFEVMNEAYPPILVGGLSQVMEYYITGKKFRKNF